MKSKLGLIFALIALVLTLILTVGKIIESNVLLFRLILNTLIFYGVGLGLELFYKKYILVIMNGSEGRKENISDADDLTVEQLEDRIKGGRIDLTAGDETQENEAKAAAGSAGNRNPIPQPVPDNGSVDENEVTYSEPDIQTPYKKPPVREKFKVDDKFIIIEDTKIPNDPKLMAEAIKTKLAE